MAATLGKLHFNEVDFFIKPIVDEEGEYSFSKDYSQERIKLNFPASGDYKMHVGLKKSSSKVYFVLSMYDNHYELVDRRAVPLHDIMQKKQESQDALREELSSLTGSWLEKDKGGFLEALGQSTFTALDHLEKRMTGEKN